MTFAEEFVPGEGQELENEPEYPTAFGITITPTVGGVVFSVLGLVVAAYLFTNLVVPAWESFRGQQNAKEEKELQIQRRQEIEVQIEGLEAQLGQARGRQKQVLDLFSDEKTLDTLLLDLNSFIRSRQGVLISFQSQGQQTTVVNDGSLGTAANGKVKRQSVTIEVEGTFAQTQSILRGIERFQSLLVVKGFSSERTSQVLVYQPEQGTVVPQGQPRLQTTLRLDALIPLTEEETTQASEAQPAQE